MVQSQMLKLHRNVPSSRACLHAFMLFRIGNVGGPLNTSIPPVSLCENPQALTLYFGRCSVFPSETQAALFYILLVKTPILVCFLLKSPFASARRRDALEESSSNRRSEYLSKAIASLKQPNQIIL